jgi:hypothetical protein
MFLAFVYFLALNVRNLQCPIIGITKLYVQIYVAL